MRANVTGSAAGSSVPQDLIHLIDQPAEIVEIGIIKRVFGFAKVRYRGLTKNSHRLLVSCALANLFLCLRFCVSRSDMDAKGLR